MEQNIFELLKRSAAIPSMPQVAARFLEIVQDPEFDYQEVVELLSTDAGTTSEILRLANSPLFGVVRQVTSLQQALALLGLKRIRSLVLGRYIVDSIDRKHPAVIDTSYYWRRSLATAVLAAHLADPLLPAHREEAFISGLLADIGVVVLDEALAQQYQPAAEQYRPHGAWNVAAIERQAIQATHGEVSAMVLEHWHLPELVCTAVRGHAEPAAELPMDPGARLAAIVGVADRIGKVLCETPQDLDAAVESCRSALAELGLDATVLIRMLAEVEPQIADFAGMLGIDVIGSKIYGLIAQKLQDALAAPAVTH